eukprot:3075692-Rhodomonas_salina.3
MPGTDRAYAATRRRIGTARVARSRAPYRSGLYLPTRALRDPQLTDLYDEPVSGVQLAVTSVTKSGSNKAVKGIGELQVVAASAMRLRARNAMLGTDILYGDAGVRWKGWWVPLWSYASATRRPALT